MHLWLYFFVYFYDPLMTSKHGKNPYFKPFFA